MRRTRSAMIVAAGICSVAAALAYGSPTGTSQAAPTTGPAQHVLLLSVDGMHESDLAWWVRVHPLGNIARLVRGGLEYDHAQTPVPSDSFPGLVGQITGGNPATTGIYYDDTYNRGLLPPGSACTAGQTTGLGSEVNLAENLDVDSNSVDAGFGIPNLYAGLPWSVLALPGDVPTIDQKMIDPTNLPIDPATCKPVYPHRTSSEHGLRGRARRRSAYRVGGQAPRLRDPRGPSGTGSTTCSPPRSTADADPTCPPVPAPTGPGQQPGHAVLRRDQGPRGHQRDQRVRPQRQDRGRRAGDLRDELPVGLDRARSCPRRR